MSPRGPGARGSSGKGQGSQGQWPDGLYSPGTTWHVVGVGFPHSSLHILVWHSHSACLCTPIPSDRAHGLMESDLIKSPLPILSCSLSTFVYLRCPMRHPVAPACPSALQEAETMPSKPNYSQFLGFSSPVSPSTHILSPSALHTAQWHPEGTNQLGGRN